MRMNKKLKNVLAFGLATSFVLTSTMGALATDNAGENEVAYGATADATSYGVLLDVTYYYGDVPVGADSMKTSINGAESIHFTPSNMPEGYVLAEGNQLDFAATELEWLADGSLYKNIAIKVDKIPEEAKESTKTMHLAIADVTDGGYTELVAQDLFYTFEADSVATASYDFAEEINELIPDDYTVDSTSGDTVVYKVGDDETSYTVYVVKKAEAKEATKKLNLAIADVTDGGYTVYSIRITVNSIRNDGTTRKDPGNGGKPRKIKGFSELMKRGGTRIDTFFEKRAHFSEQKEKLSTLSTKRAGKPHKQRVPGSF